MSGPRKSWWRRATAAKAPMSGPQKALAWMGLIIAMLAFGAMGLGGAIGGAVAWQRIPNETATAAGVVTQAGHCGGKSSTDGRATFSVAGSTYTARVACDARIGIHVQVKYDPADPAHNNDSHGRATVLFVMAAIGFVALMGSIAAAVGVHRTPTQRPSPRRNAPGRPLHRSP
ncbi:hypothetical protein [Actinomadura violacea]|uniref:DUF3592 domain-containing protein n=1 Tax=Actinomadura violacea TaxID=2819934 RepID=A0ABS3RN85_9ACTN|nr:hypothetical protein [Actinomadura violacea]MBO2458206.1 hypothetical protein [Actinomadura violacea]